ncbi:MAG TPA: sialidase family protein [Thermoanaerobaculia bacterium]|nr:sialidase family protein [Thermoanaerobaculia bacterium]
MRASPSRHFLRLSSFTLIAVCLLLIDPSTTPVAGQDLGAPQLRDRPADPTDILSGVAFLSTDKARRLGLVPRISPGGRPRPESPPAGPNVPSGPIYTYNVSNNVNQNAEPSVVSITIGATTFTTATYFQYLPTYLTFPTARARIYAASTSSLTIPDWTRTELPIPVGYTESGDPLMDENSLSYGIAPNRMYTTGIIFQDAANVQPNAIGLWHSDDGGVTWSQPTLVNVAFNPGIFLDKPAVAVATYSGNVGAVYVAYNIDIVNQPSQVVVAKSVDGGITFAPAVTVATGNLLGAQILTQPFSDKVYLVWVDYGLNAIRMSTSTGPATSWTAPETAATGNMVFGSSQFLNGNVRSPTLPVARYNWVANCVSVAWHEFESSAPGAHTDIYYAVKTRSGWQPKRLINANTTNDQFQPGVDFDNSGNLMVTFYDRSQDPANNYYLESWQRIDYLGNRLDFGTVSTPFSDPNSFGDKFIGDYQSSWFWNFSDVYGSRFNAAWTQQTIPSGGITYSDIDLTGIN